MAFPLLNASHLERQVQNELVCLLQAVAFLNVNCHGVHKQWLQDAAGSTSLTKLREKQ